MLQCILTYSTTDHESLTKIKSVNCILKSLVIRVAKETTDLNQIIFCLRRNFNKGEVKTKEMAIDWFTELFKHFSGQLINKEDDILVNVIQSINFKEAKLIESVLQLLCLMARKYPKFLNEVILTLLKRFKKEEKGIEMAYINNIINIMCSQIEPKIVFSKFAIELRKFDDYTFVGFMIETLDLILAGSENYKSLRDILRRDHSDEEKKKFFKVLFETW